MNIKQTTAYLLLVVTLIAASDSAAELRGKLRRNTYHSPAKNFIVPVPSGLNHIDDEWHENVVGRVSFHNDFGSLMSITYAEVSPEIREALTDAALVEDVLSRWLDEFATQNPQTRVDSGAFVPFGSTHSLVAEIFIPEGSTLRDEISGKRADSRRGLVVFSKGDYLYMLAIEIGSPLRSFLRSSTETVPADSQGPTKWQTIVEKLGPFYRSIRFLPEE